MHPLTPLGWIYGGITAVRNLLFDLGVLPQEEFDVPVISVGNITVGGTGKTPHTEYIVDLLRKDHRVAILSRGYKRKTKGFVMADECSTAADIGDEPLQMARKFPDVTVAVDANRREGIRQLCTLHSAPCTPNVIVLDDAFQHRYVKPGLSILLVDYNRPIYRDTMLPAGRLREKASGSRRADVVVVTKCPADITITEQRGIENALRLEPWQKLFFTTYEYAVDFEELRQKRVVLVTGIANPAQLERDLERNGVAFTPLHFPDHHDFTAEDVRKIKDLFYGGNGALILTTEKDYARLPEMGLEVRTLPIRVAFIGHAEESFNKIITDYANTGTW